jgi:hypothetical protein
MPEASRYAITGGVNLSVRQCTDSTLCKVGAGGYVEVLCAAVEGHYSQRQLSAAGTGYSITFRERRRGVCDPLPNNTPVDFSRVVKLTRNPKMPADIAMAGCSTFLQDPAVENAYWNPETMSGSMTLVGPGKHCQSVQVKVYRTSLEHFAVLYPQKKVCRPLGVLNLRNTCVERLPGGKQPGFIVRQRGFDTPMCLTFLSESPRDLDSWVLAFTSRNSPTLHQSSLPIVEEDEEV